MRIPRGIRTKVPKKSDLQNIKGRCDRDHKKAVQRDENGTHRGRGMTNVVRLKYFYRNRQNTIQ